MSLKDLINKLSPATRPDFIAPVTPATRELFTKVDGVPFVYKRRGIPNGWQRLAKSRYDSGLVWDGDNLPQPWEINSYMELYRPRWLLIVLYRLGEKTWLVYPYHEGDARQKGWESGPVPVYLVTDTVEPFDVIYACGPIYNLVYWRPGHIILPNKNDIVRCLGGDESVYPNLIIDKFGSPEHRAAFAVINSHLRERKRLEAEADRQAQLRTVEGRIKYHLEFLGAELVSWRESGQDIVISWKDGGHQYTSRISSKMQVTTAGICLSGKDKDFNVAALVDVMREARQRGRVVRVGAGGMSEQDYRRAHPEREDDWEDD